MPDLCFLKAQSESQLSDLSLCMGTSMRVSPACDLPLLGRGNLGYNLVIINLQKTPFDDNCSLRIFARTDDVMRRLLEKLNLSIPVWNNLNLHENKEWMDLFSSTYCFRSAPNKDWFEGAHDGAPLKIKCTGCDVVLRYPEGVKTIQCPRCQTLLHLYT